MIHGICEPDLIPEGIKSDTELVSNCARLMTYGSLESLAFRSQLGVEMILILEHMVALKRKCESPIEIRFMDALFAISPYGSLPIDQYSRDLKEICDNGLPKLSRLYVFPQYQIRLERSYRVDFLLAAEYPQGNIVKIIVECDGHDYHERTKDQAKSDKSRDRDLVANGYAVFRFTGSELHKSPFKCSQEVIEYFVKKRCASWVQGWEKLT